jgi:aryl-alcohol dehydrogenase-like predicted oxidoreductase
MPYCAANSITILAYSSMAQGILTGKFGDRPSFEKGDHRSTNRLFKPEHYGRVLKALEILRDIADRYAITLGQLALAWVTHHRGVCALAGARNETQVRENAGAMAVELQEADLRQMDTAGRLVTDHLDDDPVMWEF